MEGETFSFSMSNPPFFEAIEEAGKNPKTAFSGRDRCCELPVTPLAGTPPPLPRGGRACILAYWPVIFKTDLALTYNVHLL